MPPPKRPEKKVRKYDCDYSREDKIWNACHDAFTIYEQARYGKVMEAWEKWKHADYKDELWLAINHAATYDHE